MPLGGHSADSSGGSSVDLGGAFSHFPSLGNKFSFTIYKFACRTPYMREFWASARRAFRSRYVCFLEAERERLLAENRLLYDALLVKQGQPPLTPRLVTQQKVPMGRGLASQVAQRMSSDSLRHQPAEVKQ